MSEPKYITKQRKLEKRRQEELARAQIYNKAKSEERQREEMKKVRNRIDHWVSLLLQARAEFCVYNGYSFYLVDRRGRRILPFLCTPMSWPYHGFGDPKYYCIVIRNPMDARDDLGISLRNPADVVELYDEFMQAQAKTSKAQ